MPMTQVGSGGANGLAILFSPTQLGSQPLSKFSHQSQKIKWKRVREMKTLPRLVVFFVLVAFLIVCVP